MIELAKGLGVLIGITGLLFFALPASMQKVFEFFMQGKRIYLAGVIRLAAGGILLGTSPHSLVPRAALALGLLFFMSGLVIFAAPPDKIKDFIRHYSQMPGTFLRLLGLVAASFGLLIFSIF